MMNARGSYLQSDSLRYLAYILWTLCLLPACADAGKQSAIQMPAEERILTMPEKFEALEGLIQDIEIIPLETDDAHLLGSHVELLSDSLCWYLVDKDNGNIFRYSSNGSFLNKIGQRGNGPGEFIRLQDVQLVEDTLVVFSFSGSINRYRKDGSSIDTQNLSGLGDNSIWLDNGVLTYCGYRPDNKYRLSYIGLEGNTDYLPSGHHVLNMSTGDPVFSQYADCIWVIDSYSPTVYCYTEQNNLEAYLTFDFGKYQIPEDFYRFSSPIKGSEYLLGRDFARVSRFIPGKDGWLAEIPIQSPSRVTMAYCLNKRGSIHWFKQVEKDPFFSAFRQIHDGSLYATIEPDAIRGMSKQIRRKIVNHDSLTPADDNYVIAKIRLR